MLSKTDTATYEKYVKDILDDSLVPGIAVGSIKDGAVQYDKGFGYRDLEQKIKATTDTIFGIASITKSFTCVAIMQLHEQGKLSVDDLVTKHLPEFRLKNTDGYKKMTIHHFMSHSSGMPPLPYMGNSLVNAANKELEPNERILEAMTDEDEPMTHEELMDKISNLDFELIDSPGETFSYSNECYGLLGAIIERASQTPYEDYVRKNILQRIQLGNTGYEGDFAENENLTKLYIQYRANGNLDDVRLKPTTDWWDAPAMRATALLRSSVQDLLAYTQIFTNGGKVNSEQIISEESVEKMITPHVKTYKKPNQYYGYGLSLFKQPDGSTLVEHGGNGKAITASMQIIPEKKIAFVGLSNMQFSPIASIINGLTNISQGLPLEHSTLPDTDYKLSLEGLREYEGSYDSGDRGPAVVRREEDELILTSYGYKVRLTPYKKDEFRVISSSSDETITFFRNGNDELYRLSFGGRIHNKDLT